MLEEVLPLSDSSNTWSLLPLEQDQQRQKNFVAPLHDIHAETISCFGKLVLIMIKLRVGDSRLFSTSVNTIVLLISWYLKREGFFILKE